MIIPRAARERGHADHGWLDTWHSFSFADYHDPKEMGWSVLRVINDDRIAPGAGFGMHGHRDMEIVTYVLDGAIEHRDSMGNGGIIRQDDVQHMSAGCGVMHSEFNPQLDAETHLLQIWIEPGVAGIQPSYRQKSFSGALKRGRLAILASPDGRAGSLAINQDANLLAGLFDAGEAATLALQRGRLAYVHLACGRLCVNGIEIRGGDGLKVAEERELHFTDGEAAEVLVFDLPPR